MTLKWNFFQPIWWLQNLCLASVKPNGTVKFYPSVQGPHKYGKKAFRSNFKCCLSELYNLSHCWFKILKCASVCLQIKFLLQIRLMLYGFFSSSKYSIQMHISKSYSLFYFIFSVELTKFRDFSIRILKIWWTKMKILRFSPFYPLSLFFFSRSQHFSLYVDYPEIRVRLFTK